MSLLCNSVQAFPGSFSLLVSETYAFDYVWLVHFGNGLMCADDKSYYYYVRAVLAGE